MNKLQLVTMYKNNSRDSSEFKGYSPHQLHRVLKIWSSVVGYYSYTHRYPQAGEPKQNDKFATKRTGKQTNKLHIWFFANTQANTKKPKEQFYFQRSKIECIFEF